MGKSVILLYEGDAWLSTDSLVLMGVFTSEKTLKRNALKLIRQRANEHLEDAEGNCYDFGDCKTKKQKKDMVCEDILKELLESGSTNFWQTNYSIGYVSTDKLQEI